MEAGSFMGDDVPSATSGSNWSAVYKLLGLSGLVGVSGLGGYIYALRSDAATLRRITETSHEVDEQVKKGNELIRKLDAVKDETSALVEGREGKDLDAIEQVQRITRERQDVIEVVRSLNDRFAQAGLLVTDRKGLALLVELMDSSQGDARFLDSVVKVNKENPLIMTSLSPVDKQDGWREAREEERQKLLTLLSGAEDKE